MPEQSLLQRLKERKLVQWALVYLAAAWLVLQGIEVFAEPWRISPGIQRMVHVLLVVGFFMTLVLAWYHGEKRRQRASGPELLILAMLCLLGGIGLSFLDRGADAGQAADLLIPGEVEDVADALNRLPGIAVLPFANRSGAPDDRHFTDGVQDALLTRLQRVPGLKVVSRTSSDTYRDTDKSIPEVGRELGVDYVIEGGVLRAGDQVRLTVQLIDAEADDHIWAEEYDRVLSTENLMDIQSEIVRTVAGELNIALRNVEWMRTARLSTTDLEAYGLYMRAVGLNGEGRSEEALVLFQEAAERDPGFVGAFVQLAKGYASLYQYRGQRSEERAAAARAAAERAVDLAPESEDAQLAMGIYLYRVEKSYEAALDWLGRASGTLIGDYDYHYYRAITERRMGRWQDAVASHEAALALSPRSASGWREAGLTYLVLRRYADAERALQESQILNPNYSVTLWWFSDLAWSRDGTTEMSRGLLERTLRPGLIWGLAMTDERLGDAAAALDEIPELWVNQYWVYPKALLEAEIHVALGQDEAAKEKYGEAVANLESLLAGDPSDERYHAALALSYAGLGMREDAAREGRQAVEIMPLERDALGAPYFLFNLAAVHARLGEVDEALEVLEVLLNVPSRFPPNILEDHFLLRPIRDDSRFKTLMDRERERVF